jgi:transcriptional regulator with XRE-family HTH domain
MQFGELVKQRRKKLGLTQKQLAQRMGVSFQVVSKWEQSATLDNIQVSTLRKLSNALRLDIETFLYVETIVYIIMLALHYACYDNEINLLVFDFLKNDPIISQLSECERDLIQDEISYQNEKENFGTLLLLTYQNRDDEEKIFSDMLLRMFKNNKTILQSVCRKLQGYTLQHSIEQILINSDETARNEYLVEIIKNNCKPNTSSQGYTLPTNVIIEKFSDISMEFLTDTSNNKNDLSVFVSNPILKAASKLNKEGQEKALEQIELLAQIPKYQANNNKTDVSGSTDNNK